MEFDTDLKAVIFDFDGTLFDLNVDFDDFKRDLIKLTGAEAPIFDMTEKLPSEVAGKFLARLAQLEVEGVETGVVRPHAKEALAILKSRLAVAIVSRNSRECVEHGAAKLDVDSAVIVGREDVTRLKPDPEALLKATEQLGVAVNDAVMVGDTFHDVEAAHAIGMRCVVIKNPKLRFVPDGADAYIDTLVELDRLLG